MTFNKLSRTLIIFLLAIGASILLGFLSFSGLYALIPILPLAFATFGLSVVYEFEVYIQNIKGTWNKLFKTDHLKQQSANSYLLKHLLASDKSDYPEFFKDYEKEFALLKHFNHHHLDKQSKARKKQLNKNLRDMERWFAKQLFRSPKDKTALSPYEKNLHDWLITHAQDDEQKKFQQRQRLFHGFKAFSLVAGLFMGLGTSYLLVEAFYTLGIATLLPFASWPLLIIPLTVLAGSAYAFLTYNAITDMVSNKTLQTWYKRIRDDMRNGFTPRNVIMGLSVIFLSILTISLTVCTAGTWWTVAKTAQPLFAWMAKIPGYVLGIINPIITGLSSLIFNTQNTNESLTMIVDALDHQHKKGSFFTRSRENLNKAWTKLRSHENLWQCFNPFRLFLCLTITPLRILLFLGHLVSISLTADRVPGIPEIVSAILGFISEAFEDVHYFMHHKHNDEDLIKERLSPHAGHSHHTDAPTRLLKFIFLPMYLLAASWDHLCSKLNETGRDALSFTQALNKQRGIKAAKPVEVASDAPHASPDWQRERLVHRIEHFQEKHLQKTWFGRTIAKEKNDALVTLKTNLRQAEPVMLQAHLENAKADPIYQKTRFFKPATKTKTADFVEHLSQCHQEVSP
jgi:hypothetical protein